MLKWLSNLFSKNKKETLSLKRKLELLKTGDLAEIKLRSDFCEYAKTQPIMRFSLKELETKIIKGLIFFCRKREDINCFVVEIQTITTDFGDVRSHLISILEDEIEDIKKYE